MPLSSGISLMVGKRQLQRFLLAIGDGKPLTPRPFWRQNESPQKCWNFRDISHTSRDPDFSRDFHVASRPVGIDINAAGVQCGEESLCSRVCIASWSAARR
ncbi:hypothetical protein AVEN_73047-1 [Araneus ventricosus]|uniref:Uncharacterized protein n=1 Tax=Araneus ventricosus TaxID=182803 RepID=A0A4Y2FFL2_ARAVE|nr:hypothetical protein AVEN_73047-1 [Araneus ventricosus]